MGITGAEHRHHLVDIQGRNSSGPHVDEKRAIDNGDSSERAGEKGFVLPISKVDPKWIFRMEEKMKE